MKALVGAFNQEKASEGASPMDCLQVCSSIHNPTRLHGCTVNLRIAAPSREISMRFIVTDGQLVVTSSQPDKGGGRIFYFRIILLSPVVRFIFAKNNFPLFAKI